MRLTVIGCSGSLSGPDGPASCYLLEHDGVRLLLDLGSGAVGPLQRHLGPHDLAAVLISHLHPDHYLDLCGLYVARRYGPGSSAARLPVHGPTGTAARLLAAYGDTDGPGPESELAFHDVSAVPWRVGPFLLQAFAVEHPVEAYAFRVEAGGQTLAYSGDCAPGPGLLEAARGVDLALVEAGFVEDPANPPGVHHTGREAGALAAEAGAGRLVVTHVPPWVDPADAVAAARTAYDGPVVAARPGAVHDV